MLRITIHKIAPAVLSLALAACTGSATGQGADATASAAPSGCPTGTASLERFELYLGGGVSEADWQNFLDTEVTSRFPRGFTVVDSRSHRQEANGQFSKEDSRILIVVVANNLTSSAYVGAIATAYNDRFSQDTTLLVRSSVCAGFLTGTPD